MVSYEVWDHVIFSPRVEPRSSVVRGTGSSSGPLSGNVSSCNPETRTYTSFINYQSVYYELTREHDLLHTWRLYLSRGPRRYIEPILPAALNALGADAENGRVQPCDDRLHTCAFTRPGTTLVYLQSPAKPRMNILGQNPNKPVLVHCEVPETMPC
jgi:hypothetical protein